MHAHGDHDEVHGGALRDGAGRDHRERRIEGLSRHPVQDANLDPRSGDSPARRAFLHGVEDRLAQPELVHRCTRYIERIFRYRWMSGTD